MPIMFNMLLARAGIPPEQVILVRHKDNSADRGRTPYELWRDERPLFEDYQSHQSFGNRAKFSRAPKWASFVGAPDGRTLFVGMYDAAYRGVLDADRHCPWRNGEVELAGSHDVYDLRIDPAFEEYGGKLFIEWGDGARAWVQRADNQDKPVVELREKFREDPFPGFLNFMEPLSKVIALPSTWTAILKSTWGVYLLTCPKTYEQYVGSATGTDGLLGRWMEYYNTGHGGDIAFKSREPSDYQVTILETAGTGVTAVEVLEMEARWKRKLQSREMGLNRN